MRSSSQNIDMPPVKLETQAKQIDQENEIGMANTYKTGGRPNFN